MNELEYQAFSEIILPPGSTSDDLQTAVYTAALGDTIIISGDMPFTNTVNVPKGQEITIQSDVDNDWILNSPGSGVRHFEVAGSLILQNITLDGGDIGGGVYIKRGDLTINNGTVIKNCRSYVANPGGGGILGDNCTLTMNGGIITGNTANPGGGVSLWLSVFTMKNGIISDNQDDGIGNITYFGGGVSLYWSPFTMTGGKITDNVTINGNAGGIGIYGGPVEITGESFITNNSALNGNGGGMFVALAYYDDLITGADTVFSCNRAAKAFAPPPDASTLHPNTKFASTSIEDHPLNNYDISYMEGNAITALYHVTYNANGGIGSYKGAGVALGSTDIVQSIENTANSRQGYTCKSWNTEPDGSGEEYAPGLGITVDCSTMLYAQWEVSVYTVTYVSNGGIGGFVDPGRQFDSTYRILSANQAGISRPGFALTGWNTQSDGSGRNYLPGNITTITGDVTLYAQWKENPVPKPKRMCPKPVMKSRTAIEGQKIWVDDDNIGNTRPDTVEILLLRDGKFYRKTDVDSAGDGAFGFCCVPVWKNSVQKYDYQIDEVVPDSYTKTIAGNNVINTLNP